MQRMCAGKTDDKTSHYTNRMHLYLYVKSAYAHITARNFKAEKLEPVSQAKVRVLLITY